MVSFMESDTLSCQPFMWALTERMTYGRIKIRPAITRIITTVYSIMDWAFLERNIIIIIAFDFSVQQRWFFRNSLKEDFENELEAILLPG